MTSVNAKIHCTSDERRFIRALISKYYSSLHRSMLKYTPSVRKQVSGPIRSPAQAAKSRISDFKLLIAVEDKFFLEFAQTCNVYRFLTLQIIAIPVDHFVDKRRNISVIYFIVLLLHFSHST